MEGRREEEESGIEFDSNRLGWASLGFIPIDWNGASFPPVGRELHSNRLEWSFVPTSRNGVPFQSVGMERFLDKLERRSIPIGLNGASFPPDGK